MMEFCISLRKSLLGFVSFFRFKIAPCRLTPFYLDFVDKKRHVQGHVEIGLVQKFRISYNCSAQDTVDLHRKENNDAK